jgi:hypothetical protein
MLALVARVVALRADDSAPEIKPEVTIEAYDEEP